MRRRIALLRGINVGGRKKILMADLRSLCETMGWRDVKSYIQSGNLIFDSDKTSASLEHMLQKVLLEKYGFEVPVIVRSPEELQISITKNPFLNKDMDINRLHLTLLQSRPSADKVERTRTYHYEPDRFHIDDKEVFIYCEGKFHLSKLTNSFFEKKLNVAATTRNWKTVMKLLALASE